MAYKNKIYDITALEMFKRLEVFLNTKLRLVGYAQKMASGQKVDCFEQEHGAPKKIVDTMHEICNMRNDIVHPVDGATLLELHPYPQPSLATLTRFRKFQKLCFELEKKFPEMKMREVMIPTLKYDMGNAVDIVKHGLLAEFVEWWDKSERGCFRFADPFAGCPWGNLPRSNSVLCQRLETLENAALRRVYFTDNNISMDKYLGSSHLVREVAQRRGLKLDIDVSDNDKNARHNLSISIQKYKKSMRRIALPDGNNGYKILSKTNWKPNQDYHLILVDPYSDFLPSAPEEIPGPKLGNEFRRINALISEQNLFVVFVLFGKFGKFDKDMSALSGNVVSLRCPAMKRGVDESKHDAEVLLIGKQIAENECGGLRRRLDEFATSATTALKRDLPVGQKVEFNERFITRRATSRKSLPAARGRFGGKQ